MKRKSFVCVAALLLTVCFVVLVPSCKGKQGQGNSSSDPKYPIELTVFLGGGTRPTANNPMYQWIKDKFNVTFSWDILVGDTAQRQGTMIAGGQYPDLLEVSQNFIDAGALIPLENLIEQYAPNIRRYYADVWEKLKAPDGHIYYIVNFGVPHGLEQGTFFNGSAFWVQKEVLKDAGYPKMSTLDEFFAMIENYYRRNPTINGAPAIPFTVVTDDWRAFELWNPPNFLAGYPNEGNGIVDPNTYIYKNFFTNDISKRWFRYFNQLDKRGLVDRAAFADSYDQYLQKIAQGRVLSLFGQQWQFGGEEDAKRDRGMGNRTMAPLAIVFDSSITPRYRNETIPNLNRGLSITVSAKDPVRIMRFLNEYMEEEVQRTMCWGIEGRDWQWDSNHKPYRTQEQRDNWNSQSWSDQNRATLWKDFAPKYEGSFNDGFPTDLNDYYPEYEATLRPEDKELFEAYGVNGYAALLGAPAKNSLWFPTWNMPGPSDGSDAQMALRRCEATMKRLLPQMILAPTAQFDALWDAYVREMEVTNKIADYEKYMQETLDIRIREWGGTVPRR